MAERARGQQRSPEQWPARVYRLGEEPSDNLSTVSTVEERLAMLAELSRRMWELTGKTAPSYHRSEMPVRVVRSP